LKILLKANIGGEIIDCKGTIDIHWKNELQAYVSWKVFSSTATLVSKSENFHCTNENGSNAELINRVKERILSYRLGRKRVFEEVKIYQD
jgi:hypothetical protein